jgi:RNA-dependent RNA polymerase
MTSDSRVRKKLTTELRKATTDLVDRNRRELLGDDKDDIASLSASWIAWEVAVSMGDIFGAESFGWIALGAIVEALKSLDDGF